MSHVRRPIPRAIPVRLVAFTLPEVLATMVLLGIVLPVALHGVSMAMNVAASGRERAEAAAFAHTRLQQEVLGIVPDTTAMDGMRTNSPTYRYGFTSTPNADGLVEWTIEVTWLGRTGEQQYRLSTWVGSSGMGVLP